ncbi:cation:proton antiporter [Baekduia sp. Peel2402]|uniref:cation:proton antiporter n=1 Tax=Baekduia sp. Peel2402 TaxID=3458296 RepID=UPI00403EC6C6
MHDAAPVYLQLGAAVLALGLGARVAARLSVSPIPLYLIAGLAIGAFDVPALDGEVVRFAAGFGVILLLFLIGLEYSAEELTMHLLRHRRAGVLDVVLNVPPGIVVGLLLGWDPVAAVVLGGVGWASSSGMVVKALGDLGRLRCPETPAVVSVLVTEDLAMAVFLPLVATLLVGGGVAASLGSVGIAIVAIAAALLGASRFGDRLGRLLAHHSEEVVLLSVLGLVLLAAGVAETLQVGAAIGAFLAGIALSGEVATRTAPLLAPIRDFNAALFFLFFGLQVDTGRLASVALPVAALVVVTVLTKSVTGWRAAALTGVGPEGRARAAAALLPHGDVAVVLAGLAATAGIEPDLAPVAAAYVLVMAIAGALLMRWPNALLRGAALLGRGEPPPSQRAATAGRT